MGARSERGRRQPSAAWKMQEFGEGLLRDGVEIELHEAALAQARVPRPGLGDGVLIEIGVVAALAAAMPAARRAGAGERRCFRLLLRLLAAFLRGRETSAISPSRNAAKILRRFVPTGRRGRSKPGSSISPHLIMAMDPMAVRHATHRSPKLQYTPCAKAQPLVFAACPRFPSGMTNMNDRNPIGLNAIIDNVGVSADPKGVNTKVFDDPRAPRRISQGTDLVFDEGFDLPRGAMFILIQIFKDRFSVCECAPGVPDFHMPWRLSAAATSSSDAKLLPVGLREAFKDGGSRRVVNRICGRVAFGQGQHGKRQCILIFGGK